MKTTLLKTLCLTTLILGSALAQTQNSTSADPVRDQVELTSGSIQTAIDSLRDLQNEQSDANDPSYQQIVSDINKKFEGALKVFESTVLKEIIGPMRASIKQYLAIKNSDRYDPAEKVEFLNSTAGLISRTAEILYKTYTNTTANLINAVPWNVSNPYPGCLTSNCELLTNLYYKKIIMLIQKTVAIEMKFKIDDSNFASIKKPFFLANFYQNLDNIILEHKFTLPYEISENEQAVLDDIVAAANKKNFTPETCNQEVGELYKTLYSYGNITPQHSILRSKLANSATNELSTESINKINGLNVNVKGLKDKIISLKKEMDDLEARASNSNRLRRKFADKIENIKISINDINADIVKFNQNISEIKNLEKLNRMKCIAVNETVNILLEWQSPNCSIQRNLMYDGRIITYNVTTPSGVHFESWLGDFIKKYIASGECKL